MKKTIFLLMMGSLFTFNFEANAQFGKLKNAIKKTATSSNKNNTKTSSTSKQNSSTTTTPAKTSNSSNNTQQPASHSTTTTPTKTNTSTTTSANTSTSNSNNNAGRLTFGQVAAFYDSKRKAMHNDLSNIGYREWSEDFIDEIEKLDYPSLIARMEKEAPKHPEFFMLYPKKLPTSGMGAVTRNNLGDYPFASIADENAEPPTGTETSKFLNFYKEYCLFRATLNKDKTNISKNIRKSITNTENEHPRNKYTSAALTLRRANAAVALFPGDLRIQELQEDAQKLYRNTIDGFGKMITGNFHKTHMEQIVVFKNKPTLGKENEADLLEVVTPGQDAYITGYFSATNKDAGGIPSLLFVSPENKYAHETKPWAHGPLTFTKQPMFNGPAIKEVYYDKAYFVFNLFPAINSIDFSSHVEYFPLMNLVKWLRYQPSELIEVHIRYGLDKQMAVSKIKIDLTGENKQKLDEYYKKLEAKHLAAVTFPDMKGCTDGRSKITNFSDLSKYGKVLKITLSSGGDIMKPWPNDHEVDYNTASGFAAVEKTSGKVEIIPLDFRKRPTESKWQWWSIGTIPTLYPLLDEGTTSSAVKKLDSGYEILKENVEKCSSWYSTNR